MTIIHGVWHVILLLIGILLFQHGFLRTRMEVHDIATFSESPSFFPTPTRRVILLLVDALRYDFIADVLTNEEAAARMPFLATALRESSQASRGSSRQWFLTHFVADAPTTTLQRIKALTTGTLPTFLDMRHNFVATTSSNTAEGESTFYYLREDNLIQQWKLAGKRMVFVGDDTWTVLFKNSSFVDNFPLPSFNIRDLETVDLAVRETFQKYLSSVPPMQWDILIGHLLGVDHCGHTFGPDHQVMDRKLRELDELVRNISGHMHPNDLLVIFGDHGMTTSGDHGGDSHHEVDAALLLHVLPTGFPLLSQNCALPQAEDGNPTLRQIDLVPTLAALTGVPVPFSNLGTVAACLLPSWNAAISAVQHNARQLAHYLRFYLDNLSSTTSTDTVRLQELLTDLEVRLSTATVWSAASLDEVVLVMRHISETFRHVWVSFNVVHMLAGLSCFVLLILRWSAENPQWTSAAHGVLLVLLLVLLHLWQTGEDVLSGLLLLVNLTLGIYEIYRLLRRSLSKLKICPLSSGIAALLFAVLCSVYFSNSFVVHEDLVSRYLLASVYFIHFFTTSAWQFEPASSTLSSTSSKRRQNKPKALITWPSVVLLVTQLVLPLVALRVAFPYRRCREEQELYSTSALAPCNSTSLDPVVFHNDTNRTWYLSLHCVVLALLVAGHQYLLWTRQHLRSELHLMTQVAVEWALPAAGLLVALHWAFDVAPPHVTPTRRLLMAQIRVWIVGAVAAIVSGITTILIWRPLLATEEWYLTQPTPSRTSNANINLNSNTDSVVPQLFHRLREQYNEKKGVPSPTEGATVKVYGLVTAPLAWFGTLTFSVALWLLVVLGDAYLVPMVSLGVLLYFWPQNPKPRGPDSSWLDLVLVHLLSVYSFFTVGGHQAVINLLPWRAAFLGQDESAQPVFWLSASLVMTHLFAGVALSVWGGAWLWLRDACTLKDHAGAVDSNEDAFMLKMELLAKESSWRRHCVRLWHLKLIQVVCSLTAVTLHRRHLMLWKIFAPRMMFLVVESGCYGLTLLVTFVAVRRFLHIFHACRVRFAHMRGLTPLN